MNLYRISSVLKLRCLHVTKDSFIGADLDYVDLIMVNRPEFSEYYTNEQVSSWVILLMILIHRMKLQNDWEFFLALCAISDTSH